jgi:hypothetical protein
MIYIKKYDSIYMKLLFIKPSTNEDKKLMAKFENNGRTKTIHFGAKGYMDYTKYYAKDPAEAKIKRDAYDARHKVNEDWSNPQTAGTLSKFILWNKPSIEASKRDFKKRFNL